VGRSELRGKFMFEWFKQKIKESKTRTVLYWSPQEDITLQEVTMLVGLSLSFANGPFYIKNGGLLLEYLEKNNLMRHFIKEVIEID
jgi:hypothetical protein